MNEAVVIDSPRSGRAKIAQRFIAGGKSSLPTVVREADDRVLAIRLAHGLFSVARFTGLVARIGTEPSTKGAGLFSFVRFADCISRAFMNNPG